MRGIKKTVFRARGFSFPELLVATLLMGVIAAGVTSLVVMNNSQGQILLNKVEGMDAARTAIERIGMTFRMARSVGDLYGLTPPPSQQLTTNHGIPVPPSATPQVMTPYFPSYGDPNWGQGQIPIGGWPGPSSVPPWPSQPFTLSSTTLVIQIPVFNNLGYPQLIPQGQLPVPPFPNPALPTTGIVNVEDTNTYVYQIVADPNNPASSTSPQQYLLQMAAFPGSTVNAQSFSTTSIPITLLSGIVGPLNGPGGTPAIFHYINRNNAVSDSVSGTTGDPFEVRNITGLIVDLEILRNKESTAHPLTISLKKEFFMRNNMLATVVGNTSSGTSSAPAGP